MNADDFGQRLKTLREVAKLTQQQLADLAGISQNAISDYEKGKRHPQFRVVVQLARALGVTTEAFLAEPTDPPGGAAPRAALAAC